MGNKTTIALRTKTKERLKRHGHKGDSYDKLVDDMLNFYEGGAKRAIKIMEDVLEG